MQTGRKILNLRRDRNISQQDLARACDITPSALSKIEAGINSPRAGILWRISANLGVTVEYLIDERLPYPYDGYAIRQRLLAERSNPTETVREEITRQEQALLHGLRNSGQVAQEIAYTLPELSVEKLGLVQIVLTHARDDRPSLAFRRALETLLTGDPNPPPRRPGTAAARRPAGSNAGSNAAGSKQESSKKSSARAAATRATATRTKKARKARRG